MKALCVPLAIGFAGLLCVIAPPAQAQDDSNPGVDLRMTFNGTAYGQYVGDQPELVRNRYLVSKYERVRINTKMLIQLLGELSQRSDPFPAGAYLELNTGSGRITVKYRKETLADVSEYIRFHLDDESIVESSRLDTMTGAEAGKLTSLVSLDIEDEVNNTFDMELCGMALISFSASAIRDGLQRERISLRATISGDGWDVSEEDDGPPSTFRFLMEGRISLSGSGIVPADDDDDDR